VLASVISGIAAGCREAGCALIGGRRPRCRVLPGGRVDLAGFAVGWSSGALSSTVGGQGRRCDHRYPSSGLHSNGYSLARKIVFDTLKLKPTARPSGLTKSVGEELLVPTRIYAKSVRALIEVYRSRRLPTSPRRTRRQHRASPAADLAAVIDKGTWEIPPIFRFLKEAGSVDDLEMMLL